MLSARAALLGTALAVTSATFAFAAAQAAEVTTLPDGRRLVVERPAQTPVKGTVLLIPGSSTMLTLGPGGETTSSNFVIRTRRMLTAAGFATAYMDDPGDLRLPIARLRAIGRPVVVLATSRGTIAGANAAARLGPDGPDLLVLTSPVTTTPSGARSAAQASLADVNLRGLKIPTLVTTNDNDACDVTPPAGAAALAKRIGANAALLHFSSTESRDPPCEPLSPHGYFGIESTVLAKIVDWIAAAAPPSN